METINKLLKKQPPKLKGKTEGDDQDEDGGDRPPVAIVRWINSRQGSRVAVPKEMLSGPAGAVFGGAKPEAPRLLVEEVL